MRLHPAKILALSLALLLAPGCALHKAQKAVDEGRYDEALAQYRQILRKDPSNLQAKIGVRKTAPLAAEVHLGRAKEAMKLRREDVVRQEVAAAVSLDPSNAVAVDWMNRIEEEAARQREAAFQEDSVDQARAAAGLKPTLPINPRSLEGMDLNFTRKTSLKEIFQQLSRNSGVNIILHGSVSAQDPAVSVDLRGLTFQRVLDTLMLQSDLFYKVLDPNTIMVFKKTPQNLQDYENKLIQTFYLSNAEVDNVRQIFNAIMPQVRVFIDKRLNALTVQAKASDLAIAQRIVGQLDKAKAEVVVYLELMEVNENATQIVGLMPTLDGLNPNATGLYRLGATTADVGANGVNINTGGTRITKANLNFLFPPLVLDALKANGEGKLLASPNVRVLSGETGEVNIGEKISTTQSQLGGLPTSASTATPAANAAAGALSTLGGALTTQTQYSYEDVGVQIKVKPRVHFNGDITIDLESTVKTQIPGGAAGRPNLGQRIIKTSARLRDGETAVFGGLLKEDEQKSLQGVWGLTDLPILGSLLGHTNANKTRTDVILTLRAVIVRKPDLAEGDFEPFDPDQAPSAAKPFAPKPAAKAPARGKEAEPAPAGPAKEAAPDARKQPVPGSGEAGTGKAAAEPSSLVFFMSPLASDAVKGQPVTVTLFASGGQGLTSGTMALQVDPKLKVLSVTAGDFLTAEGGSLQAGPAKDGLVPLTFQRETSATDSGTFATLQLETVEPGKATVLVQDGKYLVGANPVPARYVNALVTIQ